jgi:hypothetical protein
MILMLPGDPPHNAGYHCKSGCNYKSPVIAMPSSWRSLNEVNDMDHLNDCLDPVCPADNVIGKRKFGFHFA